MRHSHGHIVLVAGGDNIIVTDRAACLGDVADTAFTGAFDIVAKGEEGVRAQGNARLSSQPGLLFLTGEGGRLFGEQMFPVAVR